MKPAKRVPARRGKPKKRVAIPKRTPRLRIFSLRPDWTKPHKVVLYFSPNRRHMLAAVRDKVGLIGDEDMRMAGMVRSWSAKTNKRTVVRPGNVIAYMFLNVRDVSRQPWEIPSHECVHAALRWGEIQKVNLKKMVGEEVVCYAQGRMLAQLAVISHRMGCY